MHKLRVTFNFFLFIYCSIISLIFKSIIFVSNPISNLGLIFLANADGNTQNGVGFRNFRFLFFLAVIYIFSSSFPLSSYFHFNFSRLLLVVFFNN